MLDEEFLNMLVCPEQRTPLRQAEAEMVQRVNEAIAAGRVTNHGGVLVERKLDGGLLREDGQVLYPILDGIPVLLRDESIHLDQLDN